ncbi:MULTISPECIES: lytic transglycosylase domain-containing protein [Burkholderia]|uniref:lytic transglycosylase domain-containing protein n=1 Tax=Burkholderia TaxID=32008 RepID=UPI000C01DF81|nr:MULTISPECIES: lytic transglycosylase domain-containing protein [Burkholderia]PFH20996.1 transglycosylase-like protein with SLT domain [Burkholderia sp. JKS000303]
MTRAWAAVGLYAIGWCAGVAPAYADGVAYVVGGRTSWASRGVAYTVGYAHPASRAAWPARMPDDVAADATPGAARGVVLSGAGLAVHRRAVPAVCAGCGYDAFAPLIGVAAADAQVDPALVAAVIAVESGFNDRALSPKGARGLMQLMPSTALRFGVSDATDPVQNVVAGTRYLGSLIRRFSGNVPYALAAYNAGEKAVTTYGGVPPYAETQAYVPQVLARYTYFRARGVQDTAYVAPR